MTPLDQKIQDTFRRMDIGEMTEFIRSMTPDDIAPSRPQITLLVVHQQRVRRKDLFTSEEIATSVEWLTSNGYKVPE